MNRLFEIWIPTQLPKRLTDHYYVLIWACYAVILFNTLFLGWNVQTGISNIPNVIQITIAFIILILLKFRSSYTMGAHLYLLLLEGIIAFLVIYFRQFPYTILLWQPIHAAFCLYFFEKRTGTIWSAGGLAVTAIILLYRRHIPFPTGYIAPGTIDILAVTTMTFATIASFGAIKAFIKSIGKLSHQLNMTNQLLALKNADLTTTKSELDALVIMLTHDISNMLAVIGGMIEVTVRNERISNDIPLTNAQHAIMKIKNIIRDVAKYQVYATNKEEVIPERVDLVAVVKEVQEYFAQMLEDKELELTVEGTAATPIFVHASKSLLSSSIISNLISNAIKFSHKNGRIIIRIEEIDQQVIFTITDFGIGIPSSLIGDLFRFDKSTTRAGTTNESGTGFGLPTVKLLMEKFGGCVDVSSSPASEHQASPTTTFKLVFKKP